MLRRDARISYTDRVEKRPRAGEERCEDPGEAGGRSDPRSPQNGPRISEPPEAKFTRNLASNLANFPKSTRVRGSDRQKKRFFDI